MTKIRDEEFSYTKKNFVIEWFSGTVPGGQNRNKVQNCVRITHIESGLSSQCTSHRDRKANFNEAFRNLGEKLKPWIIDNIKSKYPPAPKNYDTIRTYHEVDNRVKDHASGKTVAWSELDDKLDELIEARLMKVSS